MQWIMVMLCATLGGWLGWWLGGLVGTTSAMVMGLTGSGVGWYVAIRVNKEHH